MIETATNDFVLSDHPGVEVLGYDDVPEWVVTIETTYRTFVLSTLAAQETQNALDQACSKAYLSFQKTDFKSIAEKIRSGVLERLEGEMGENGLTVSLDKLIAYPKEKMVWDESQAAAFSPVDVYRHYSRQINRKDASILLRSQVAEGLEVFAGPKWYGHHWNNSEKTPRTINDLIGSIFEVGTNFCTTKIRTYQDRNSNNAGYCAWSYAAKDSAVKALKAIEEFVNIGGLEGLNPETTLRNNLKSLLNVAYGMVHDIKGWTQHPGGVELGKKIECNVGKTMVLHLIFRKEALEFRFGHLVADKIKVFLTNNHPVCNPVPVPQEP